MNYVLDTSAIFAYIEEEPGVDHVQAIFDREENVFLPWPVLMEVYYITMQEKGQQEAEMRFALLKRSLANILWEANEAFLLCAATLKAKHKVSFADALIATYAITNESILVHKDPEYEVLTGDVEMEFLPYK